MSVRNRTTITTYGNEVLRYKGGRKSTCVMLLPAKTVLHMRQGFGFWRYMLAAHITHANFFADVVASSVGLWEGTYTSNLRVSYTNTHVYYDRVWGRASALRG